MAEIQNDIFRWLMRFALAIVLVSLGAYDWRHKRVPNRVVRPLLLVSAGVMLARIGLRQIELETLPIVAAAWSVCVVLWWLRVFGGGDMKLVMALIALVPEARLVYLLLGAALGGLLLNLIIGEGRLGLHRLAALLATASHGMLPDRAEIAAAYRSRGRPITFAFCLAGVAYLWLFWGRV